MYRRKTRNKYLSDAFILLALAAGVIIGAGTVRIDTRIKAYQSSQFIHPLSDKEFVEVEKEVVKYELPKTVEEEIRAVFGEHADDAMKVLSCENKALRADATNDNRTWGGVGVDHGIFQINDYWQGFRHGGKATQFLHDPSINIRVAYRIFVDDGYTFNAWTCGKKMGL